ncbi:hypothetical protein [Haliotid herpesvirus 1]|nr:hypothetical protein [Haliotid herpesvirus 1]
MINIRNKVVKFRNLLASCFAFVSRRKAIKVFSVDAEEHLSKFFSIGDETDDLLSDEEDEEEDVQFSRAPEQETFLAQNVQACNSPSDQRKEGSTEFRTSSVFL